jgi:hypothetical protein
MRSSTSRGVASSVDSGIFSDKVASGLLVVFSSVRLRVKRVDDSLVLHPRADHERGHAVGIDVVAAVLRVVLDDEDRALLPDRRVAISRLMTASRSQTGVRTYHGRVRYYGLLLTGPR